MAQPKPEVKAQIQYNEPERVIGTWYGSKSNAQYWLQTILTLTLYHWLIHQHNSITLSTRRVTQKRGNFLTANETSISMENITNVDVNQSLLGRIFNYGDIVIQTAGSGNAEILFVRLANPIKLRESVFDLKDGRYDETKQ